MISYGPTVARLKAAGFAHAEGLLEMIALADAPRVDPALFVIAERDAAQPNRLGSGVIDQKVTETFSIVILVGAARRAASVSDALKDHSDKVIEALLGWRHPEASGPCEYVGGRLVSMEGPQMAWAISFSASRHIRKESQ